MAMNKVCELHKIYVNVKITKPSIKIGKKGNYYMFNVTCFNTGDGAFISDGAFLKC